MALSLFVGKSHVPATKRPGKGKSIISFPSDYCVVHITTTGYSPAWDYILEICAIRYKDGVEIDRFQSLVQPPAYDDGSYVDSYVEALTGITDAMLADAPTVAEILPRFLDFVGNAIILGYYASYAMNFLYDACVKHLDRKLPNDYVDVLRLARKICPDLPHHRLKDMDAYYSIGHWHSNQTINDCEVIEQVYRKLIADGIAKFGSEDGIIKEFKRRNRYHRGDRPYTPGVKAADIIGDEDKAQPDCPIYQRHCCITGKLEFYTRKEAMQLIADLGGINDDNVTKATNFLILGNNDYCTTIKDDKSSKQKKAEAARLKGQDIEIMPESVFYDMIAEYMNEEEEQGLE